MNDKVKLADASNEQLHRFAESHLGMTFPGNTRDDTMRAKIAAAWNKDEIPIIGPEAAEPQSGRPPRPVRADQQPPKKDMVRVHIAVTEDVGGDEPVQVGVNGSVMLIPRGKDVDIPYAYFEVLEHAVTHRYEPGPDGLGINPVPRKVKLYPYQRIA